MTLGSTGLHPLFLFSLYCGVPSVAFAASLSIGRTMLFMYLAMLLIWMISRGPNMDRIECKEALIWWYIEGCLKQHSGFFWLIVVRRSICQVLFRNAGHSSLWFYTSQTGLISAVTKRAQEGDFSRSRVWYWTTAEVQDRWFQAANLMWPCSIEQCIIRLPLCISLVPLYCLFLSVPFLAD